MKKINPMRSLYDLAFGLLFIFIIASSVLTTEYNRLKQTRRYHVPISEEALFNPGEYWFKNDSLAELVIKNSIDSLYSLLESDSVLQPDDVKNILIIGHTDNIPISLKRRRRYGNINYSNWNLSLDRANAVVQMIKAESLLVDKPGLTERMLMPAGKGYSVPSTVMLKFWCKNNGLSYVDTLTGQELTEKIDSICECNDYRYEQVIEFCNSSEDYRKTNRRITIKLEF